MPNKTIYVADDDVSMFERAQQLAGGSLSAAISQALRRFVEQGEAHLGGFGTITVGVGSPGTRTQKRFTGVRLVRWSHPTGQGRVETFTVYRTARGRFAVHLRRDPDWARWSEYWQDWDRDWTDPSTWSSWSGRSACPPGPTSTADGGAVDAGQSIGARPAAQGAWWESGEYQLDVYDTLDELNSHLPPELAKLVEGQLEIPLMEDLDI